MENLLLIAPTASSSFPPFQTDPPTSFFSSLAPGGINALQFQMNFTFKPKMGYETKLNQLIGPSSRAVLCSVRESKYGRGARKELFYAQSGLSCAKGASINDLHQGFGIFDPLPPCMHLELIYIIKFIQPPLLHPLFYAPSPL